MIAPEVERLRAIQDFQGLIRYLREELEWPIADDVTDEDMVYEYTPEEVGLNPSSAIQIKSIERLRPLVSGQPWGIFFIDFKPGKLPITVLRRILRALVKTKRATRADRKLWELDDLLFISRLGEDGDRSINLAHFSEDGDGSGRATLRVVDWDEEDSYFHMLRTADELDHLRWPKDPRDVTRWRKTWASAFELTPGEAVKTSKQLAVEMARMARLIRSRVNAAMAVESDEGPLRRMFKAFREVLLHDLTEDDFADMYAQTITYGLFTARKSRQIGIIAENLADMVPPTNPFLRDLLAEFTGVGGLPTSLDFDELGIDALVDMLNNAKMDAIIADFDDKNPQEDPVIHFYELFLKEYDPKKRVQRGIFFTPRPVVSFIVRSVHGLLRTEFGLEDGLADTTTWGEMIERQPDLKLPDGATPETPFVQILDPAVGTGTFLVEVIDVVHRTMVEKWTRQGHLPMLDVPQLWNDYVANHLLPRLYGFELMMAPYAIAHMKIGLKLEGTGYKTAIGERLNVYLTNSLEPAQDYSGQFETMVPALAHEAAAVNAVKRNQRFTVVIGNPPYSSISSNMNPWIRGEANTYIEIEGKRIEEKSKRNPLQNDYVKFIRTADLACSAHSLSIFAYITSNSYLDGRTLRGLRWHLLQSYDRLQVLNLYGDSKKRDACEADENVFDITEGVSIVLARRVAGGNRGTIRYGEIQDRRAAKYKELQEGCPNVIWHEVTPTAPYYLFKSINESVRGEFVRLGPALDELFQVSGAGLITNRDDFATDTNKNDLLLRMQEFSDRSISDSEVRERYDLRDNSVWKLPKARADFQSRTVREDKVVRLTYRPFDARWMYYDKAVIFNPRFATMNPMLRGHNLALVSTGQTEAHGFNHIFVSRDPVEKKLATRYGASVIFPLFLFSSDAPLTTRNQAAQSNLTAKAQPFLDIARKHLGVDVKVEQTVIHFAYAILHSEGYRKRYAEELRTDFPRLPLISSEELFRDLAQLGSELIALHLVEATVQQALCARYDKTVKTWRYDVAKGQQLPATLTFGGPENPVVEKVSWSNDTVWLDAAKPRTAAADSQLVGAVGFHGVREDVWNFHIGGYQVCEKWLKDRRGRELSAEDITHYGRIVVALAETIRLMGEIDEVIEQHGGWPGAFQAEEVVA